LEDIFDLQDEITQNIVAKLKVKLENGTQSFLVKRYTEDAEAYSEYLKGRYHLNQRTEQSLLKALECFEQAISRDSRYALPHAGLAEVYILLNVSCPRLFCETNPRQVVTKAREAARKAIELDDSCAEAHVALALVYYRLDWDWKRAQKEFHRALELNPDLATGYHQYAMFLASLGRLNEALDQIMRAHALDPLSPIIGSAVGRILHFARRFDEAIDQFLRTLDLNSQSPGVYFDLGLAYTEKGMYSEAIASFKKLGTLSQDQKTERMELAWTYGRMGERKRASELLEELLETSDTQHLPNVPLALIHLELGDFDKAFTLFEEGYALKDSNLVYLQCEPAFDLVRKDSRFQDFLRRLNFPQEAIESQLIGF
jgi:tetratricopeptide (TPR) repeat protein